MKSFFNIGRRKPYKIPDVVQAVYVSTGILRTNKCPFTGGFKTLGEVHIQWAYNDTAAIVRGIGAFEIGMFCDERGLNPIRWLCVHGIEVGTNLYFLKNPSRPVVVNSEAYKKSLIENYTEGFKVGPELLVHRK